MENTNPFECGCLYAGDDKQLSPSLISHYLTNVNLSTFHQPAYKSVTWKHNKSFL